MEDPIFVCEVAQSLVNQASDAKKGGRKSVKEKQKILTDKWSKLLEVSSNFPILDEVCTLPTFFLLPHLNNSCIFPKKKKKDCNNYDNRVE